MTGCREHSVNGRQKQKNKPRNAPAAAGTVTKYYVLSAGKLRGMEVRHPNLANALHHAIVSLLAEQLTVSNGLLRRLIDATQQKGRR